LYGAIDTEEIEFGSYKGRRKWENLRQIPTQQIRDALMNMIVFRATPSSPASSSSEIFWKMRPLTGIAVPLRGS